jgi:hypothetical protein
LLRSANRYACLTLRICRTTLLLCTPALKIGLHDGLILLRPYLTFLRCRTRRGVKSRRNLEPCSRHSSSQTGNWH